MINQTSIDNINKFRTLEMVHRESRFNGEDRTLLEGENNLKFLKPCPDLRELLILLEIEKDPNISQSHLAQKVNLAPSMVNNYIKNLTRNGRVKMQGVNRRRTTYHLSPEGIERRGELLSTYMMEMLRLYRNAKGEFRQRLAKFYDEGLRRVVLYGAGETAFLVISVARDVGLEVVGVVDSDPQRQGNELAGRIIDSPGHIEEMHPDGVIITSLAHRNEIHKSISHLEENGIKIRQF